MATAFENLAPRLIRDLIRDLGITPEQAAGIVGNAAAESGLLAINERRPVVSGSPGGFGWFQWTSSRRVAFERWCSANSLNKTTYEANYGFLLHELATTEAKALTQLRKTTTPKAAAETFEHFYERAGVKNYAARIRFAERALALYRGTNLMPTPVPAPPPGPTPIPVPPIDSKPWYQSRTIIGGIIAIALPLLGRLFPLFSLVDANTATDYVLKFVDFVLPFVGAYMVVTGRVTATQPIEGTKVARVAEQLQAEGGTYYSPPGGEPAAQPVGFMFGQWPDIESFFPPSAEAQPGQPASPQTFTDFGKILAVISQAVPYVLAAKRFLDAHPELQAAVMSMLDVVMKSEQPVRRPS